MNKTFYGYIRVSTARQGEGVSLQEQRASIERFAAQRGLTVERWFEERETAAKTGRPIWNEMLRLLRKRAAAGVVIHKIDRGVRNGRDWVDLTELVDKGLIELYFANEGLDLTNRGGRLSADLQAVVAADYIRNLREEALKGINGRLKQGILPLPAPVGYLDCGAGKPKAIDPVKGPLVRHAFELYSTGQYNLRTLLAEVQRSGLKNRRGGEVSVNGLATMLRNPFYIGLIRVQRRKETYEGAHDHLLKKSLFDQVQAVLDGKLSARPARHDFLLRRTVRCKSCGYSLIGETQKGFIYYRCHSPSCPTTNLKEETADGKVSPLFLACELGAEERTYLREKIESMKANWQDERVEHRKALDLKLSQIAARRARLTDALIDGLLDRELFEERQAALLSEKQTVEEQLANLADSGMTGPQKLADFLERLDSAHTLYQSGTIDEKRELLAKFTSNWLAAGKDVDFTALPEVQLVAKRPRNIYGGAKRDGHRTACEKCLDGPAKQDISRYLDLLLKKLTKLLLAKPVESEEGGGRGNAAGGLSEPGRRWRAGFFYPCYRLAHKPQSSARTCTHEEWRGVSFLRQPLFLFRPRELPRQAPPLLRAARQPPFPHVSDREDRHGEVHAL